MHQLFRENNNKLECLLCPHLCKLSANNRGICGVRKNTGTKIELTTYGVISGYALDPVEKKPLYHFFPGYNILSAGSYGCNMRCDYCQNYSISQKIPKNPEMKYPVESLIKDAVSSNRNIGIAFTYNEPVIWFEYMRDVAYAFKEKGLFTVMVSNGYVNKEPLSDIITFIDAFNIDLKAFNNTFYKQLTGAELEPVKNSLKQISDSGKHLEITTLIIPGYNDDLNEMQQEVEWIAGELGRDIPFHLSRYFPMYKRSSPSTSSDSLKKLYEIASKCLDYVYIGNIYSESGQNTKCPDCGNEVTQRTGYTTKMMNLSDDGKCNKCGKMIYKYLTFS